MISQIQIENFKSFGQCKTIDLNNITLFSGVNSSGKSTITQALLLLGQSQGNYSEVSGNILPTLKLNGETVQLGRASELLYDPRLEEISLKVTFSDQAHLLTKYRLTDRNQIGRRSVNRGTGDCLVLTYQEYKTKESFVLFDTLDKNFVVNAINTLNFPVFEFEDALGTYLRKLGGEIGLAEDDQIFNEDVSFLTCSNLVFSDSLLKSFRISLDEIVNCINLRLVDVFDLDVFKQQLLAKGYKNDYVQVENIYHFRARKHLEEIKKVTYLPAFRGLPKRVYTVGDDRNPLSHINLHLHDQVAIGYDFSQKKVMKGTLHEAIDFWIVNKLKIADKIELKELVDDLVSEAIVSQEGRKVAINNVGFGVSQVLPLILNVLTNRDVMVVVDEPESHLHPALQSLVGEFLFSISMTGKKIVVETHSEYLVNTLTYLSLLYPTAGKKCYMYWVFKENGMSNTRRIEFDDLGFVVDPPPGFFDERSKQVQMLSELRIKRTIG